jgi:lysophospholipase L1-like esterase
LLLLLAADRFAGWYVADPALLFPPHSAVTYQTGEFTFVAQANSAGFRDREFPPARAARLRVIVLGDSFTFGWGVAQDEAWPKALERLFPAGEIEIANLGQPGAGPAEYERIARRAVPMLRPDLVIVAVLQGDDLAQTILANPSRAGWRGVLSHGMRAVFPNLMRLVRDAPAPDRPATPGRRVAAGELKQIWAEQARVTVAELTPSQREQFKRIPEAERASFLAGELNPFWVRLALRHPDYFMLTLELGDPAVTTGVTAMRAHLAGIQQATERIGATCMVVIVPHGVFVSPSAQEAARGLGFAAPTELLTTPAADASIARAAAEARVSAISVTDAFRPHARSQELYFPRDGHFNARGHAVFAELLAPAIRKNVDARARRTTAGSL